MNEQEMQQEIERLRRELDQVNQSRERLRQMICTVLAVDPPEVVEKQLEEMMKQPPCGIDDIIADLIREESDLPSNKQSIPA